MLQDDALKQIGIWQQGIVATMSLQFDDEIRAICEGNVCRRFATTWACPPAVGTVEQCKKRCLQYRSAMVFSARYPLEDSFDYEGMVAGHGAFKKLCDNLYLLAKESYPQFLLLSNEGCNRCESCTYPASECRFPQLLFHSLEGYGFNVKQLADSAGILYHNGQNTVTYFGMLLFDD